MATVASYAWALGTVRVTGSGLVKLDGKEIGKVVRFAARSFGAWVTTPTSQVRIHPATPLTTLDEAVGAVYDEHVTTIREKD